MTAIKRLYVLLCGYETIPKYISVSGADNRFMISEPICAYLLDTTHGWILLDAGMDPQHVTDPQRLHTYFTSQGMIPPIVRTQHDLKNQLAEIGITLADISWIILSHLHFDHTGYIKHCPQARVSVQKRDYDAAMGADYFASIAEDFNSPTIRWDFREGDWDAFPGLTLLDTRGHTPGHQSALVQLKHSGALLLTFDAGDLMENFNQSLPPGSCADQNEALSSLLRIKTLAETLPAQLILFHDPQQIQQLRLSPEYYE
ncbi:N-acyl homoserine lactonase family protein [Acetobacter thailandicus]|uniref:N-acyl homoserine lactonase family protein n=1 Tax=Acetobacter thailandicus TaxID=1502842 RepID=UPI001BAE2E72|nr:N-acyl homoserine lactonase family protein [Acetobacter thailandicus]MBS0986214.1 N-acyl homoserine lactonase family protein [Acetobacter thailandicus]